MKLDKLLIWHVLLFCLISLTSYRFMSVISFSDVSPVISILQNGSAMIFTIMGIWIAYIYPQAMRKVIQPSSSAIFPTKDKERVQLLVGVVVISAIILAVLLIGTILKPLLVKSNVYALAPDAFSFFSLFILLWLVYAQLFCIYSVIASNVNFIIDLVNKENGLKLDRKLNPTKDDE